jgi:phosphate-selective porin
VEALEENSKKPLFVQIGQGDLKISGFTQVLYRHYGLDSQNDSFSLPRVRLKFDGHLRPELAYCIQIEAAASEDILRDAYIKYTKYPSANIIVGQTFIPFSEEQLYPTPNLEFIDRTLVTSRLSYDRDIGIQLQGKFFDKKFSYGAGVFNGAGRNTTDNNDDKDVVGRIVISPFRGKDTLLKGLSLGTAFQHGEQPQIENTEGDRTVIDTLVKYEYNKLKIQSEYLFRRQEQIAGLSDKDGDGWYIMTAYYLLPELQGAVRYEQYDPDRDIGENREDALTLGLNYFFSDYLKLQVNYLFKEEETEVSNDELALQLQIKH